LIYLTRGHELGSGDPRWNYPSAMWVKDAERLSELDGRLSRVLARELVVADAMERISYAELCYRKRWYDLATRFYEEALSHEPALAADLKGGHRYNASCAAALVGTAEEAHSLQDIERARRRRQARDWLRADLRQRTKELEDATLGVRAATVLMLQHWMRDPNLKGLRDNNHLAKLTPEEREDCVKLWNDVRELQVVAALVVWPSLR
jgi:hypothetical protein